MASSAAVFAGAIPADQPRGGVPWTIWAGRRSHHLRVDRRRVGCRLAPLDRARFLPLLAAYRHLRVRHYRRRGLRLPHLLHHIRTLSSPAQRKRSSCWDFARRWVLFIAAWGGIAMIVSAPFDNWWHAAYGLDVKIISPPHTLLILGVRGVSIGVMFLVLAALNRAGNIANQSAADAARYRTLRNIFLYLGGVMITGQMFFLLEPTWDVKLHSVAAYIAMGIALPVTFGVISRGVRRPLGLYDSRCDLHGVRARRTLGVPPGPRLAETRPGLLPGHAPDPRALSDPDRSSLRSRWICSGPACATGKRGRSRLSPASCSRSFWSR